MWSWSGLYVFNVENGGCHITSRGNRREAIFLDKRDHLKFLDLVGELDERYRVQVHGYVLMISRSK